MMRPLIFLPVDGVLQIEVETRTLSGLKKVNLENANREGKWASRSILKYNANNLLLGNLIKRDGRDFCDYPYFEEPPKACSNSSENRCVPGGGPC